MKGYTPYVPIYQETVDKMKYSLNLLQSDIGFSAKSYSDILSEATYNTDKIYKELDRSIHLNKIITGVSKNVEDIASFMMSFHDYINFDVTIPTVNYYFDVSNILPFVEKETGVKNVLDKVIFVFMIKEMEMPLTFRGGVGSQYANDERAFLIQIVIDPHKPNISQILNTIHHELTHLLDFIRSNGRTQYEGYDLWQFSDLRKSIVKLMELINIPLSTLKKKSILHILKHSFFTSTEINARVHEVKKAVENGMVVNKHTIWEIPSFKTIKDFNKDLNSISEIPQAVKKEVNQYINDYIQQILKRLQREKLLK